MQNHDAQIQAFGQRSLAALSVHMPTLEDPVRQERLQTWMRSCVHNPQAALRDDADERVVVDLVTLELARQLFAFDNDGLLVTDGPGAGAARQVLEDLLRVLENLDPQRAGALARLARDSRNHRLHDIRQLIVSRS